MSRNVCFHLGCGMECAGSCCGVRSCDLLSCVRDDCGLRPEPASNSAEAPAQPSHNVQPDAQEQMLSNLA
jgi:hypothetical protein